MVTPFLSSSAIRASKTMSVVGGCWASALRLFFFLGFLLPPSPSSPSPLPLINRISMSGKGLGDAIVFMSQE